ncbi:MAG: DUF2336 domain-containing protein [Pacificimonas sp.]
MTSPLPDAGDVERLLADPSTGTRRVLAEKLGRSYSGKLFSDEERGIADEIVRAVARDVEIEVRRALAESISLSRDLPADVARQLANDVADVAEPVLLNSDLLADKDLIAVVRERSEAHRLAIAARVAVSAPVADALSDVGEGRVLERLVDNEGADIAAEAFDNVLRRAADPEAIAIRAATRKRLPMKTAERLISLVSARLRTGGIGEGAMAGAARLLRGDDTEALDVMALIERLSSNGGLKPSLVLRAAEAGDWELALTAIVRLTGRSRAEVNTAMRKRGDQIALLLSAGQTEAQANRIADRLKDRRAARRSVATQKETPSR